MNKGLKTPWIWIRIMTLTWRCVCHEFIDMIWLTVAGNRCKYPTWGYSSSVRILPIRSRRADLVWNWFKFIKRERWPSTWLWSDPGWIRRKWIWRRGGDSSWSKQKWPSHGTSTPNLETSNGIMGARTVCNDEYIVKLISDLLWCLVYNMGKFIEYQYHPLPFPSPCLAVPRGRGRPAHLHRHVLHLCLLMRATLSPMTPNQLPKGFGWALRHMWNRQLWPRWQVHLSPAHHRRDWLGFLP